MRGSLPRTGPVDMPDDTVNWEKDYVPLYRNADGTTWLRFVGDRTALDQLSLQFGTGIRSSPFASVKSTDPVFVRYDPDLDRAVFRQKNQKNPAADLLYAKGAAFTWRADMLTQRPITGHKWVQEASPFFAWAFLPSTMVRYNPSFPTRATVQVLRKQWKYQYESGIPLLDVSPLFAMLGTRSPLVADTKVFLEWLQENQNEDSLRDQ